MEKQKLKIIAHGSGGEGVAKYGGKVFFVDGAVSGETVLAETTQNRKSFTLAKTTEVLEKSPFRQTPPCKYYGVCGGCALQHITDDFQREIKTQNVKNLLEKAGISFPVLPCKSAGGRFSYRNKITLYWSGKGLGFFKKKSWDIIPISKCLLVDEDFNNLIELLNHFFAAQTDISSALKAVAIRKISDTYILNLVLSAKKDLVVLSNFLIKNKISYSLYFCVNARSQIPTYPAVFVGGEKEVFATEFGIKYPVYPMSFLQVNNAVKNMVYSQILSHISNSQNVIDAYSGAGLLSAIIARVSKSVTAVEIDKSASLSAAKLCKINSIKNLKPICADCAKILPSLVKKNPDCLVLDPSRKGVAKNVLEAVAASQIPKIIYLSCNPATLARDLKILCQSGYHLELVQPYDMFPQTAEIEVLTLLTKPI